MAHSFGDAPGDAWAEVQAHDRVTRYRRLGAGPAVLLLGTADGAELLAATFRVIVPELPATQTDIVAWLTAFLEGLGTRSVAIVAKEPFYAAAVELARLDPDRVVRVVRGTGDLLAGG